MTASVARRQLLQLAAASASTLWLPRSARAQRRLDRDPFALGVARPPADRAVLRPAQRLSC